MNRHVEHVVSGQDVEQATAAVVSAVNSGGLTVLALVGLLQQPLTDDENHEGRARAVQLLSKVAEEAPGALQPGDVGVLAEFLGSKLSDWRCLTAALHGCQALLKRHTQPSLAPLPTADAVKLVSKFVQVHVQGLDYRGRTASYELLLALLQGPFAVPAVLSGTDLAYFMVVAMENEADPRCLLVALRCVEAVGKLYQQPQLLGQVDHLQQNIEDLFDACVAPYFPVVFNAPKNDTHRITRDMLVQRVVAALACCPDFAPLAIPLLSEKLGSDVRQAKEDSLAALPVCLGSWGSAAVKPHMQAVWLMLKSELMAPAAAAEGDSLQLEQLPAKRALAVKAAACLQASTAALGPGLLDQQVLNDVAVEDLMQYLGLVNPPWAQQGSSSGDGGGFSSGGSGTGGEGGVGSKQHGWSLPLRAQRRLACIASCVAAVVGAGGTCTAAACDAVLSPALNAVLQDTAAEAAGQAPGPATAGNAQRPLRPLQANCGVLCVLHHSLQAVTAGAADTADAATPGAGAVAAAGPAEAYAAVAALMPKAVLVLDRLQQLVNNMQQQQQEQGAGVGAAATSGLNRSVHEDALQREQLQLWLLLLQQDLLSLPPVLSQLQQPQLTTAAQQLLRLALHGSRADTELELFPGLTTSEHAAAATALILLASWPTATAAAAAALEVKQPDGAAAAATASEGLVALTSCAGQLLQILQEPGTAAVAASGTAAAAAAVAAAAGNDSAALRSTAVALLGQLAGSSSAAAWQVLQWVQPLLLQHVQQSNWVGLVSLLPTLNDNILPALPEDLTPQQSAAAAAVCADMLQAWQQQQPQQQAHQLANGISTAPGTHVSSTPDVQPNAVLQSCLFLGHLAARCSLHDQRQLLLPVCEWVTQAAAAVGPAAAAANASRASAAGGTGALSAKLPVGLACIPLSVLAAARPGLLTAPSTVDLVQAAAALAVSGTSSSTSSSWEWLDSTAAAVATAGIINKCLGLQQQQQQQQRLHNEAPESTAAAAAPAVVQPEQLLAAALQVLTQPVQQQQQPLDAAAAAAAARAVQALGWVARGLALQRHTGWQDLMQQLVLPIVDGSNHADLSATAPAGGAAGPAAAPSQLTWAAADFFAVLVAPFTPHTHSTRALSAACSSAGGAAGASTVGHLLSLHCMARPLWQQKAFVLALDALRSAAGLQQQQQQQGHDGVWLAVASCVCAAPAAIAAAGEQDVLLLIQCVVHLFRAWQAPDCADAGVYQAGPHSSYGSNTVWVSAGASQLRLLQLLHSCLVLLCSALQAGNQAAAQLEPHVEQLLQVLCQLAHLRVPAGSDQAQQEQRRLVQEAAAVREVCLMCLASCMSLPYHLLHPHRRQVLAAVTAALDDDRRAVRKAAVVCKGAWGGT